MAHLAELYAKDLGVRIGEPILNDHWIPLPHKKYITIHTSDKVSSKNYSYWEIVVKILKKNIDYPIIQIGTVEDQPIDGVDMVINNTHFNQSFFILKNSSCHIGIDSCPVHIAASFGTPTVAVYGHTYAQTCDTSWTKDDPKKHIALEPVRENGECPSFSMYEDPKTIDRIKPETIAESAFKLLGIKKFKSEKTLFIGKKYLHKTIDLIPATNFTPTVKLQNVNLRLRMDFVESSKNIELLLHPVLSKHNNVTIITKQTLPINILEYYKANIRGIEYKSEEFDEEFLNYLRGSKIPFSLCCLDKEKISEQRNKYFHFQIDEEESDDIPVRIKKQGVQFDTGKVYLAGDGSNLFSVYDLENENFWIDAPYWRAYINV